MSYAARKAQRAFPKLLDKFKWYNKPAFRGMNAPANWNKREFALPKLGPELVLNGGFDTDLSGWTNASTAPGTISWSAGRAAVTSDGVGTARLRKVGQQLIPGALYELKFELTGTFLVDIVGVFTSASYGAGSHSRYFVPTTSNPDITFRHTIATTSHVDNVSVKQVRCGKGVSYGPELVTNGTFDTDLTGWTITDNGTSTTIWEGGKAKYTGDGTNNTYLVTAAFTTVIGRTYTLTFTTETSGLNQVYVSASAFTVTAPPLGTVSYNFVATATSHTVTFRKSGASTGYLDNVSVKEGPFPAEEPVLRSATEAEYFAQYVASSTSARTYIDSAGVLRDMTYDRTNLLNYSDDYSQWIGPNANLIRTASIEAAPDGTMTAWTIDRATAYNPIYRIIDGAASTAIGDYTFSAYVKPGTLNRATLMISGDAGTTGHGRVLFDMSNGTWQNLASGNLITAGMEPAANGWWRCWVVANIPVTSTSFRAYIYPEWYNQNIPGSVHVWRAQVEPGRDVTSAKQTTGTWLNGGVNAPRYDWSSGTWAVRNYIQNSGGVSAVLGTINAGAALPTNWTQNVASSGLGMQVLDKDADSVTLRIYGTGNGSAFDINFETAANVPVAVADTYTISHETTLVAAPGNVPLMRTALAEYNGASWQAWGFTIFTPTSTPTIFSETHTVAMGGTNRLMAHLTFSVSAATTYDFTIKIKLPTLVKAASPGTPWRTTGSVGMEFVNAKRQLLLENAATNHIRNNTMQGAAVAGAFPNNWTGWGGAAAGITTAVAGLGTENGHEYIDVRFTGTAASTGSLRYFYETTTGIAAATGETWAHATCYKLVASPGSVPTFFNDMREYASGVAGSNPSQSFVPDGILRRVSGVATLVDVGTTHIVPYLRIGITSGVVYDFTLRIAVPQAEKSAFSSSVIKTYGTAVTRAIETFRLPAIVEAVIQRNEGGVVVRGQGLLNQNGGRIVGMSGGNSLAYAGAATNVSMRNDTGPAWVTVPVAAGTWTGSWGLAAAFDNVGRTVAMAGGIGADTNQPGDRSVVYLGRAGSGTTTYGDGRYDFFSPLVTRPANSNLQAMAVAA